MAYNSGMQQNDPPNPAMAASEDPLPVPPSLTAQRPVRAIVFGALSWVRDLTFSVLIAIVLIVFIYQPVKVEGTSMMPTLVNDERIFINKFTYKFGLGDIERGDTVVFWYPEDKNKSYIKRVIGLPGDRIRIDAGQVYVNGQALAEEYVPEEYRDRVSWPRPVEDRVIPQGEYFVLGDHRSSSSDSRTWGYVPRDFIYGKAVFVYWPLDRLGRLR
jgi:signal peptidase I